MHIQKRSPVRHQEMAHPLQGPEDARALYSGRFAERCFVNQLWLRFQFTISNPLPIPRQVSSLNQIYLTVMSQQAIYEPRVRHKAGRRP